MTNTNTKTVLAMSLAQNDLQARACFNGIPANKYNWLINYICNKYNKTELLDLIDHKNELCKAFGVNFVDMNVVPEVFSYNL